jgi:hypothetical protein
MATLTKGLRLSELSSMSDEQRSIALGDLFYAASRPTDDQLREQKNGVRCEIHHYESRYTMSSADMKRKLVNGEIRESADICSWLMLLKLQDDYNCQH